MGKTHQVMDLDKGEPVGKPMTKLGARAKAERLNLEYGAHRYAAIYIVIE